MKKMIVVQHGIHGLECPDCKRKNIKVRRDISKDHFECVECDCIFRIEDVLEEPVLTPEQIFFNKVKGKKIRRKHWLKHEWFKPDAIVDDNMLSGADEKGNHFTFGIGNGWGRDIYGFQWELYPEPTPEEIFFEQVKGKKIRWTGWGSSKKWIIAEVLSNYDVLWGIDENGKYDYYGVYNGFKPIEGKGYHWELCDPNVDYFAEIAKILKDLQDMVQKAKDATS